MQCLIQNPFVSSHHQIPQSRWKENVGKFVKLDREINGANFFDLDPDHNFHKAELLDLGTEDQLLSPL